MYLRDGVCVGEIGEHVSEFFKEVIEYISANKGIEMLCEFNDIEIKATSSSTVESLVQEFNANRNNNCEEYKSSEEYKQNQLREKEKIEILQMEANQLMKEFKSLNIANYDELLPWLLKIQPYSDDDRILIPNYEIVSKLKEFGHVSEQNTGDEFLKENRESVAKYVIGQCISGFEFVGAIHPMITTFINNWTSKYIA